MSFHCTWFKIKLAVAWCLSEILRSFPWRIICFIMLLFIENVLFKSRTWVVINVILGRLSLESLWCKRSWKRIWKESSAIVYLFDKQNVNIRTCTVWSRTQEFYHCRKHCNCLGVCTTDNLRFVWLCSCKWTRNNAKESCGDKF